MFIYGDIMNHNQQKKIGLINDYTGFGRCSISVSLPIISKMKIQCCPLPTSIFSNHTGYDSHFCFDFTKYMKSYMEEWIKLDLRFNGILTGYLGSLEQIRFVLEFIDQFKKENTLDIVDPVMGDNGKIYKNYSKEMTENMYKLIQKADIITPNLTEACILCNMNYKEDWTEKEIETIARKLAQMGPDKVVITGMCKEDSIYNYYHQTNDSGWIQTKRMEISRAGTGDLFSSIIAADAIHGVSFEQSILKATHFISKCIEKAIEMDIPYMDGVPFEEVLDELQEEL